MKENEDDDYTQNRNSNNEDLSNNENNNNNNEVEDDDENDIDNNESNNFLRYQSQLSSSPLMKDLAAALSKPSLSDQNKEKIIMNNDLLSESLDDEIYMLERIAKGSKVGDMIYTQLHSRLSNLRIEQKRDQIQKLSALLPAIAVMVNNDSIPSVNYLKKVESTVEESLNNDSSVESVNILPFPDVVDSTSGIGENSSTISNISDDSIQLNITKTSINNSTLNTSKGMSINKIPVELNFDQIMMMSKIYEVGKLQHGDQILANTAMGFLDYDIEQVCQ